jgi:cytidine deaminase
MKKIEQSFTYEVYDSINELNEADAWLLNEARQGTKNAYAPYSNFQVGAIARLTNGEIVAGSNQENASFPLGLCAERVLLASTSSLYPQVPIASIAISYFNRHGDNSHPITPCGICRQSLMEYENKFGRPIRLILGGMEGKVYVIQDAKTLLPLSFSASDLK